jgi:hypothetical protein
MDLCIVLGAETIFCPIFLKNFARQERECHFDLQWVKDPWKEIKTLQASKWQCGKRILNT